MTATTTSYDAPPTPGGPRGRGGRSKGQGRVRQGSVTGLLVLVVLLALTALLSLAVGSRAISPPTVLSVLFSPDGTEASTIVHELRLPRTVLAILVGLCLGVAGTLMQGHTRNPLADPGLLGISAGASFAVVLGIFAFGVTSLSGYAWLSMLGAGLAGALVFSIGSTRRGPDPVTLVLAGTAVAFGLTALTSALLIRDADTLDEYRFWVVGSVAGRGFDVITQVLPFMVAGLALAAVCTVGLNLLQLGDDTAAALGLHPLRHKIMGLGAVMLLTGAATAACGPIVFLGLTVPHVARWIAGVDHRWLVPYAGLLGGVLLTLADVAGRLLVVPAELQVGIVMALIGGPAFILLVRRSRMVRL